MNYPFKPHDSAFSAVIVLKCTAWLNYSSNGALIGSLDMTETVENEGTARQTHSFQLCPVLTLQSAQCDSALTYSAAPHETLAWSFFKNDALSGCLSSLCCFFFPPLLRVKPFFNFTVSPACVSKDGQNALTQPRDLTLK